MDICTICGEPIEVGEFPCIVTPRPHARGMYAAHGDEIDLWQENGPPQPIHFTSKIERKRWLKANGFEEKVRHVPGDKHCASWDVPSPKQLEDGRILVARMGAFKGNDVEPPVKMRITLVSGEGIG